MSSNNQNHNTLDQLNQDLKNLDLQHGDLVTALSKVNEEIKLLQEERIKLLEGIWNTPPAETLETPPILDTHGANNQGMREEPPETVSGSL